MSRTKKVAPGRKSLTPKKLRGMALFRWDLMRLEEKYSKLILTTPIDYISFDMYKCKLWDLCIDAPADDFDKRLFFIRRLESMLDSIEAFKKT